MTETTNKTINGISLYNENGYLNNDLVKEVSLTLYSRHRTCGGRLFFQEIVLIDDSIITHTGNTASTRGIITRHSRNSRENVLQRDIKNRIQENTVNY